MNFIEKTSTYKDLQNDFEYQCRENARKQERILAQKRVIEELEHRIDLLTEKLEASDKEYDKLVQSLSKKEFEEVADDRKHNTIKQTHGKRASRQK